MTFISRDPARARYVAERTERVRAERAQAFRTAIAQQGGTVLESGWHGMGEPHLVRCHRGHETSVNPSNIQNGQGMCRFCAGLVWDALYVVTAPLTGSLKFGITSGDPRSRLGDHARRGYTSIERLLTNLPDTVAPDMERAIAAALRDAGEIPLHGVEYFSIRTLPTVLATVDTYQLASLMRQHTDTPSSSQIDRPHVTSTASVED